MDKETLKYVLAQATTRKLPEVTARTLNLPLDSRKIATLVGIRRSGKTYLLYDAMRRLGWAAASAPRATRVLVTHERSARKPPAGIQVVEAWRYLLGAVQRGS